MSWKCHWNRDHENQFLVLFVQLSIILDLAVMAAGMTEPSGGASTTSGYTATGGEGDETGMHVLSRNKKVVFLGSDTVCWVCSSGAGGPRTSAGFRVFSLIQILPR